jgi:hypothetical protein
VSHPNCTITVTDTTSTAPNAVLAHHRSGTCGQHPGNRSLRKWMNWELVKAPGKYTSQRKVQEGFDLR